MLLHKATPRLPLVRGSGAVRSSLLGPETGDLSTRRPCRRQTWRALSFSELLDTASQFGRPQIPASSLLQWRHSSLPRPLHRAIACLTKAGAKLQHSFRDE